MQCYFQNSHKGIANLQATVGKVGCGCAGRCNAGRRYKANVHVKSNAESIEEKKECIGGVEKIPMNGFYKGVRLSRPVGTLL